ncbi:MAG: hypothetical protein E7665_04330 [Ruminococcaceae bacterium]|nr:hypothetical protein [Oscillospiraceae bacterium]
MFRLDYHERLDIIHDNTLTPCAYFIPFASDDTIPVKAADGIYLERSKSSEFISLCGSWSFSHFEDSYAVPDGIEKGTDAIEFQKTVNVPSCWQVGCEYPDDMPNYTNVKYPFPADPPYIPKKNPVGVYSRNITVKKDVKKDYHIVFEGVAGAYYLYVNGKYCGYSEVSHSTSVFDISDVLSYGANNITVVVFKWYTGSYLEDQDMFRLNGIFREVYILERQKARINDFSVKAVPCDNGDGLLSVSVDKTSDGAVDAVLYDPNGGKISEWSFEKDSETKVPDIKLWSAEAPVLYTLTLSFGGETIAQRIGFKSVEIKDGVFYVNGKNIKLRGVNRHDSDPFKGYAVSTDDMLRDLYIMKRHNVNALRTSHYPNDPRMCEMCAYLGIYLVDEADLETHGMGYAGNVSALSESDDWTEAYIDRAVRLYERDKNQSCIVMFSLGNESGCGKNHYSMRDYILSKDASLIIHYEGASGRHFSKENNKQSLSPIESTMYPSFAAIHEYLDMEEYKYKPYFMCEYSHCMGNGPGDIADYWEMIEKTDRFMGGCLWEFTDHSIATYPDSSDRPKFNYGGDFNDYPNDGNFCVDGLVYPDRRVHVGLKEAKNVYKPVEASYNSENNSVVIFNKRYFESAEDIFAYITVENDGRILYETTVNKLDIAPRESKEYALDFSFDSALEGTTTVNVFFKAGKASLWCDFGYDIGFSQIVVSDVPRTYASSKSALYNVSESPCDQILKYDDITYVFSKKTGTISDIRVGDTSILSAPMSLNVWRAPTDNDMYIKKSWKEHELHILSTEIMSTERKDEDKNICYVSSYKLSRPSWPSAIKGEIKTLFDKDGSAVITVTADIAEKLPALPKFGWTLTLNKEFDKAGYLGYGPDESYADKRISSRFSYFETTAEDNYEPYIRPQENGSHYKTVYASVSEYYGKGIEIYPCGEKASDGYEFDILPYSAKELTEAHNAYDLGENENVYVSVDYKQNGIGSNSCGPALLEKYAFNEKHIEFSIRLVPSANVKKM